MRTEISQAIKKVNEKNNQHTNTEQNINEIIKKMHTVELFIKEKCLIYVLIKRDT